METSSNWLCDLSYAILQWLECKENIFAKSFLFKDVESFSVIFGVILIIVGELYVDCNLFMVRKDFSLKDNYLYTSFVPVVSRMEFAEFCSEDATCGTATYDATSRTCSLSMIQSDHDASGYLFTSAFRIYVMSRFRYPGKIQLEQCFTSAAAAIVIVVMLFLVMM